MRTLFDDEVFVHYGQIYVTSAGLVDMTRAFAGQSNGLCGAGVPGGLFLITATHTGNLRFTVEWHDTEPADVPPDWEEVVEVSYAPATSGVALVQWAGERSWPLDVPGTPSGYRVRYHAVGMAEAHDETARDRYLLQFWPAQSAGAGEDVVLRQTTAVAEYWHNYARSLPRAASGLP